MRSIRLFLISCTLAVITIIVFVATVQGYRSSMEEADRLFDNHLLDIANLVANVDTQQSLADIRLSNNVAFQIWEAGEITAASANAPGIPMGPFVPSFDYENFNGYRWRTYSTYRLMDDRWIIVAERTDLRFVIAENVVLESVTPVLLGLPFIGLIIWVIVSQGLHPLDALSRELKLKQSDDLKPVSMKDSKQELEQVIDSINGFIQRLAGALDREKRFSADAAHELRTPISALKIQLHNLGEVIDPELEPYRQLREGVERMQHIVEQLLSLYRITPEQFESRISQFDLLEVAQDQAASLYQQIEAKQQKFELLGESTMMRGDRFGLELLLSNLLSNAIKNTPESGNILVAVGSDAEGIQLIVEDSGPGIAASERERVFDRFYSANANRQLASPVGSGLGLAIVSHIVELHQADIAIHDSRFDTGTAFRIRFDAPRWSGITT